MGEILLVTGGCRSGKSAYAQARAEAIDGKRVYLATAPVLDDEMRERIRKHKEERKGRGWITMEEQVNIFRQLQITQHAKVILVDCLTLWVNNLMYHAAEKDETLTEETIMEKTKEVLRLVKKAPAHVIFVTNEVGMSVVPENASARLYRDLVGRCNQVVAVNADEVILMSCGLPLRLKPQGLNPVHKNAELLKKAYRIEETE